jgi:hypothetical protein
VHRHLASCLAGVALIATAGAATAHHSTALYGSSWISLEGTVVDYRYANPHAILVFRARGPGGQTTIWHLEGLAPALLARQEWSRDTLKPGDELKLSIRPLRSGANGGFWHPRSIQPPQQQGVLEHAVHALAGPLRGRALAHDPEKLTDFSDKIMRKR